MHGIAATEVNVVIDSGISCSRILTFDISRKRRCNVDLVPSFNICQGCSMGYYRNAVLESVPPFITGFTDVLIKFSFYQNISEVALYRIELNVIFLCCQSYVFGSSLPALLICYLNIRTPYGDQRRMFFYVTQQCGVCIKTAAEKAGRSIIGYMALYPFLISST